MTCYVSSGTLNSTNSTQLLVSKHRLNLLMIDGDYTVFLLTISCKWTALVDL